MQNVIRLILGACSLALVFASLLPLHHGSAWWIRIFDFPRMQIALLLVLVLAGYGMLRLKTRLKGPDQTLAGAVALALALQLFFMLPYSPVYPEQMQASRADNDDNRISLFIYNVLHDNRKVEPLRRLIRETDPDVVLLSETTPWWLEQLAGLENDYPHTMLAAQENNYGMLLYSRFELIDPEVRFLVEREIPSFRVKLRLRSGQVVTLYGVHPRPPGLRRQEPQTAGASGGIQADVGTRVDADQRDAELLLVAREAAERLDEPIIVGGDFNDVAWSHSTRLFQRIGGLLDPRIGRGLYNSYDARHPVMRYPLDHVFASGHFRLVKLRRLPAIGSDHFPMLVVLDFDSTASVAREEPKADAGDKQEAQEAIREGRSATLN